MDLRICGEHPCVNGESLHAGRTAWLVRCAGCNLRCPFCDTPESWEEGVPEPVPALAARALASGLDHLLLTGGEPLLQPDAAAELAARVLAGGMEVVVETNGTRPLDALPRDAVRVVDLKAPGARPSEPFLEDILPSLGPRDQLKAVLTGREDYEWVRAWLRGRRFPFPPHHVLLSPAVPALAPADLASWVLEDRAPWRVHLQLHKVIWGDRRGV